MQKIQLSKPSSGIPIEHTFHDEILTSSFSAAAQADCTIDRHPSRIM